jgi:carboxyl-terminal processing protease
LILEYSHMKKFLIGFGTVLLLILFTLTTFAVGFVTGRTADIKDVVPKSLHPFLQANNLLTAANCYGEGTSTPEHLQELFKPFWQAWDLVSTLYVDQPVNQELLMRGAIGGMVDALGDEHSSYLDPSMFEAASAHLDGEEYEGIGAWVDTTGDFLTIISPMPGSPAEKAGLISGDKVIAIDGEDMTGIDGEAVRQRVIGPKGSIVILTIAREGEAEPFDVEVTREGIIVPTISGEMLEDEIAYIQILTFGDTTAEDLTASIQELKLKNPVGLIIDLRNNGGGYLNTAIEVVSQFIDEGTVMYEVYGDGREERYTAIAGGAAIDIPLVVLINQGSASASEIVAGAIQDRGRGYLVGEQSYGKGSVQSYSELINKQGAVRVTIARWLTPDHRQISKIGLQPDFQVEITEEDAKAGKDTQLEKAIEVLLKGLTPPPTPVPTPTSILP